MKSYTVGNQTIHYLGPDIANGPLPGIIYFALSSEESLSLDPFNQPAICLEDSCSRIFSITLPEHEEGKSKYDAIKVWATHFENHQDPLSPFLDQCEHIIQVLIKQNIVDKHQIAVMGLSRGGLIAFHLAARIKSISHIVAFAPVIDLFTLKEFASKPLHAEKYSYKHLIDDLYDRSIRIFIGNRDIKVGVKCVFDFTQNLVEKAFTSGIRSVPIELFLKRSIGLDGHGTDKSTFEEGGKWLKHQLINR